MTFKEIEPLLKRGKTGLLPKYVGYIKWDYASECAYMQNGDYKKYDLDDIKHRTDFYYII